MITTATLDGSPEAVLDRLIDEIRVEWSQHPHVTQWVLRTASIAGDLEDVLARRLVSAA